MSDDDLHTPEHARRAIQHATRKSRVARWKLLPCEPFHKEKTKKKENLSPSFLFISFIQEGDFRPLLTSHFVRPPVSLSLSLSPSLPASYSTHLLTSLVSTLHSFNHLAVFSIRKMRKCKFAHSPSGHVPSPILAFRLDDGRWRGSYVFFTSYHTTVLKRLFIKVELSPMVKQYGMVNKQKFNPQFPAAMVG